MSFQRETCPCSSQSVLSAQHSTIQASDYLPFVAEPTSDDPDPEIKQCTYLQLYSMVADLASALLSNGVRPGDRVASYSSNCIVSFPCLDTSILRDSFCSEWENQRTFGSFPEFPGCAFLLRNGEHDYKILGASITSTAYIYANWLL
jgi:acyl-CoA synthetase (AMP-forming)/AMP-acid ligase II